MPQNNQMSMCFNQLDNGNEYNMHMQYEKFSIQKLCKLDQSSKIILKATKSNTNNNR